MQLSEQDLAPKYSKWYNLEVPWAKIYNLSEIFFPIILFQQFFIVWYFGFFEADFSGTLKIKGTVWWVLEASRYSLELRRIIALTHRYSLCCSFISRNLEVMARSISKISKIPSTHFPSSLWGKHIQHVTKKVELRNWLRQIKVKAWRRLQKAYLVSSLGEFKVLSWNLNWILHWYERSAFIRKWFFSLNAASRIDHKCDQISVLSQPV